MIYRKPVYPGEAYFVADDNDKHNRIQRLTEAHAEIHSLYLSGAPVFTRQTIQDVGQQLRKLEGKCGKVFIRGLDGVMVEFAIETGRIVPSQPHTEFVIGAPFIYYCPIQELTSINDFSIPRITSSSLRIYHYMALRNKFTKENLEVVPTESLEDTKNIFKTNQKQWEESEKCKQLTSIVQSINISVDIQQIVAFACGSIRDDSEKQTPRSSFQHVLVLTLRNILSKKQEDLGGISCYAQDPAYSEVDILILRENGITVLDDPEGFHARLKFRIEEHDRDGLWADPDSSRIRKMILEFYDVFEIPGVTENFGDVVLYIDGQQTHPQLNNPILCSLMMTLGSWPLREISIDLEETLRGLRRDDDRF